MLRINSKHVFRDIKIYMIWILIILQSGTLQVSVIHAGSLSKVLAILLVFFLMPYAFNKIKNGKCSLQYAIYAIVLLCMWIVSSLRYPTSSVSLMMKIVWFILFAFFQNYAREHSIDLFSYFFKLVVIIAGIALVFFCMISIFHVQIPGLSEYTLENVTYYNLYNIFSYTPFYYTNFMGLNIYRLHSIFWEPGVYQIYLNLAIFYCLYIQPKLDVKVLVILLLNLLFTVSTTGLCIGLFLVAFYIYRLDIFKKIRLPLGIFASIIIALGCFVIIMDKRQASIDAGGTGSYNARINDMIVAFRLFLDNFLVGAGYDNGQLFIDTQGWDRGNTNGLFTWFYTMGIWGVTVLFFPFIRNILLANKPERIKRIIAFGMFVLFNMSEPLYWSPLMWFWVAVEYVHRERISINELEKPKDFDDCTEVF